MAINLYTSRIILDALGVVDYGIYNVVGSFVGLFTMINASMTTATQRFLSFQIGKGNKEKVQAIFSTTVLIHILLALVILLLAESIGLWFINNEMQITDDRMFAANMVFHMSVFALMLKVISLPYSAAIIAYEKMSTFAYISIIEAILSLFIVFLLYIFPFDKLIFYSILVSVVSVLVQFSYWLYVKNKLGETCFVTKLYKGEAKELVSFVSWNIVGSSTAIAKEQGISLLLNIFFGATINAARGIALQLRLGLNKIVSNFSLAMNPQIVKSYSVGDRQGMTDLIIRGSKFSLLLLLIMSTPLYVKAEYVLSLWLVEVPDMTLDFLRIIILTELLDSMQYTLVTGVLASGRVKSFQLTLGFLRFLCLPIAYVFLKIGCPATSALYVSLATSLICHIANAILLSKIIYFPYVEYFKEVTLRMIILSFLSIIISTILCEFFQPGFLPFVLFLIVSLITTTVLCYTVGLNKDERIVILKIVRNKIIK